MNLILRKDKYIKIGRCGIYFLGFGERLNYFYGFGERRQILLGRQGHNLQGGGEINALFSEIKGAQTPLGASEFARPSAVTENTHYLTLGYTNVAKYPST